MYVSEVWGFHSAAAVVRVYTAYCKSLLSLRKSSCNAFVYGELHTTPLKVDRHYGILKYWLKMIMFKPNPLVYKVYTIEMEGNGKGTNWSSLVFK